MVRQRRADESKKQVNWHIYIDFLEALKDEVALTGYSTVPALVNVILGEWHTKRNSKRGKDGS